MKIKLFYFVLIISILASCKSKTTDEEIAKELCTCMEPIVKMYDKTEDFTEDSSLQEVEETMAEVEKEAAKSEACADGIEEKYGDLSEREDAIESAMERVCPDIMKRMEEMESQ